MGIIADIVSGARRALRGDASRPVGAPTTVQQEVVWSPGTQPAVGQRGPRAPSFRLTRGQRRELKTLLRRRRTTHEVVKRGITILALADEPDSCVTAGAQALGRKCPVCPPAPGRDVHRRARRTRRHRDDEFLLLPRSVLTPETHLGVYAGHHTQVAAGRRRGDAGASRSTRIGRAKNK